MKDLKNSPIARAWRLFRKRLRRLARLAAGAGLMRIRDRKRRQQKLTWLLGRRRFKQAATALVCSYAMLWGAEAYAQTPTIVSRVPAVNASDVALDAKIVINFNATMDVSSFVADRNPATATFAIHGSESGHIATTASKTFTIGNTRLTLTPQESFIPGEIITVSFDDVKSSGGVTLGNPITFQFRVASDGGTGAFTSSTRGTASYTDVAMADFDRDGLADAIFTVAGGAANEIWLGRSNGNFNTSTRGAGDSRGVAIGDMDGDGDMDAIVANYNGQTEFWRNYKGNFSIVSFGQSSKSVAVDVGDLDGDGDLDIYVANEDGEADEIFFNNGYANFTANSSTFGANNSVSVMLGDLDNDGDLDVLLGRRGGSNLRLTNVINTGGLFITTTVGGNEHGATIADFNDDGTNEVYFAPTGGVDVEVADFDFDGDLDRVIVMANGQKELHLNNGNGTFSSQTIGSIDDAGMAVAVGDLDLDGDLDFLVAKDGTANEIYVNIDIPHARITELSPSTNASSSQRDTTLVLHFNEEMDTSTLQVSDDVEDANIVVMGQQRSYALNNTAHYFNGDKTVEVTPDEDFFPGEVITVSLKDARRTNGGKLTKAITYQFFAEADGGSARFEQSDFGSGNSRGVALGDLDGDGDLDVVIANYKEPNELWLNNGDITFSSQSFGSSVKTYDLGLGDLDNDGDLDIVEVIDYKQTNIWYNDGSGSFPVVDAVGFSGHSSEGRAVSFADFNSDGWLDIIIGAENLTPDQLLMNNGDGSFESRTAGGGTRTTNNFVVDLNHDGDIDVLAPTRLMKNFRYNNDGAANFSRSGFGGHAHTSNFAIAADFNSDGVLKSSFGGGTPDEIIAPQDDSRDGAPGDFNGDGFMDYFVARNRENHLMMNNGDGTFSSSEIGSGDSKAVAIGDLDNDGDLDVVLANHNGVNNILTNTFPPFVTVASPRWNEFGARDANVEVVFSEAMQTDELDQLNESIFVHSMQHGNVNSGSIGFNKNKRRVIINPSNDFFAGEEVWVSVKDGPLSWENKAVTDPRVYSFRAASFAGSGEFDTQSFGQNATGVAVGDLDGDGDPDAFLASSSGHVKWINNGSGVFSSVALGSGTGEHPVLGDLDNDGDLDVVVGGNSDNEIFLNNGSGNFSRSSFSTGVTVDIALTDLNGDGFLDAFVAKDRPSSSQIWLGNGDGSFSSTNKLVRDYTGVAVGDLDGDGDVDAVCSASNGSDTQQSLWLNQGNGNLSNTYLNSTRGADVAIGDLNGDGDLDVVIAVEAGGAQKIWTNNGDATFVVTEFGGGDSKAVELGDLDGDQDLDVIVTNDGADEIWLNNGDGSFKLMSIDSDVDFRGALADFDGDFDLDGIFIDQDGTPQLWFNIDPIPELIALTPSTHATAAPRDSDVQLDFNFGVAVTTAVMSTDQDFNNLTLYGNQSGHISSSAVLSFTNCNKTLILDPAADFFPGEEVMISVSDVQSRQTLPMEHSQVLSFSAAVDAGSGHFISSAFGDRNSQDVAIGDLDGDGDLDAIVADIGSSSIWINAGDGTFADNGFSADDFVAVELGDLDGDGDLDAALANAETSGGSNGCELWFNNGSGGFSSAGFGGNRGSDVAIGDVNGDGDLDVLLARDGQVVLGRNDGSGSFSTSVIASGSPTRIALGDFTGDGRLDILVGHSSQPSAILRNEGGSFSAIAVPNSLEANEVAVGDLNGDGHLDALLTSNTRGDLQTDQDALPTVDIWLNNGDQTFSTSRVEMDGDSFGLALGDVDNDNDLDVFVATNSFDDLLLRNNGSGGFSKENFGGGTSRHGAFGDIDGDGSLDLIVARSGSERIWYNLDSPLISKATPNSFPATVDPVALSLSGWDIYATSGTMSVLDGSGTPVGTSGITIGAPGLRQSDVILPAGMASTAGTLTLTLNTQAGATSTTVTVVNDQPTIAIAETIHATDEDTATTLSFSLGDVWPGISSLSVLPPTPDGTTIASISQLGSTGATTQFVITPVSNQSGTVDLTFEVTDGDLSSTTSLTLTVVAVNDRPTITAASQSLIVDEDHTTSSSVQLDDIESPVGQLQLSATSSNPALLPVSSVTFATPTSASTQIFFEPLGNANGQADITVSVSDGALLRSTIISVTVTPINDAPTISSASAALATDEDTSTALSVLLVDVDTPMSNLILWATSNNQSVLANSGIAFATPTSASTQVTLDPVGDANGQADVTVFVDDGEFIRSTSFSITVNAVNDAPTITAANALIMTDEDTATSTSIQLNDIDNNFSQLIVTATSSDQSLVANSGISIGATAATVSIDIDPLANANGSAIISVSVTDGEYVRSTEIALTVNPVNDPSSISVAASTLTTSEDITTSTILTLGDIDTPMTNLILSATTNNPSLLSGSGISFATPTSASTQLTLDPEANANGQADVTIFVNDGEFIRSTSFTFVVNAVNDAPIIATSNTALATNEDTPITAWITLADLDNGFGELQLSAASSDQSLVANGAISFPATTAAITPVLIQPTANANGAAAITISVTDGEFIRSTSLNLAVLAVNDAPTIAGIADISFDRNHKASVTLSIDDVDNTVGGLLLTATSGNSSVIADSGLTLGATSASMTLTIDPECDQDGPVHLTVTVSDGALSSTASFTALVKSIQPLAIVGARAGCPDVDVNYSAEPFVTTATHVWSVQGGQIISGQGTHDVAIRWDDNTIGSLSLLRTFENACTNATMLNFDSERRIAAAIDHHSMSTHAALLLDVMANDIGIGLSLIAVDDPDNGTVSIVNGKVEYTPDSGFSGLEFFQYSIQSIDGCSSTGAILVAVAGNENLVNAAYIGYEKDRVDGVRGLNKACATAVTPNGKYVYAAGRSDHSIAMFETQNDGSLRYLGRKRDGSGGVDGLKYVSGLAIAPDGKHLYAAGYGEHEVAIFTIDDGDGTLSYQGVLRNNAASLDKTIQNMKNPRSLAVSPDGLTLYVSAYGSNALVMFRRIASTGQHEYIGYLKDGVGSVNGLYRVINVAVSPDGRQVFAAGYSDHALAVFNRDLYDGTLSFHENHIDGRDGVDGLKGASAIAVSPDAKSVYVAGKIDDAVAVFSRNPLTGDLSFVERWKDGSGCDGLDGICGIAVSPDGLQLWTSGSVDDALSLFTRDEANGELGYLACLKDGVDGVDGLNEATGLVCSPNSAYVYCAAGTDDAISCFLRNRVPRAYDESSQTVLVNNSLTIDALRNDEDLDKHKLTISSESGGSIGTVTISGGGTTLTYEAGASTGTDSFSYTVDDGHGGSSTATVTVNVVLPKRGMQGPGAASLDSPTVPASPFDGGNTSEEALVRVSPHPVRDEAAIRIETGVASAVRLRILDLEGRAVAEFSEPASQTGAQMLRWNARQANGRPLATGVYVLLLQYRDADGQMRNVERRIVVQRL